mgnify:CR=1 FL=1
MSTENDLLKLINDAAKKVEINKRAKPQPLNGGYRNQAWYRHVLKGKTMDEAYEIISANLKTPSFAHEVSCALEVYREMFNDEFKSKEERKKDALIAENEALKKKLAEMESKGASVADAGGDALDPNDFPPGMDKDKFKEFFIPWHSKSQGFKPVAYTINAAWKTYQEKNEIKA